MHQEQLVHYTASDGHSVANISAIADGNEGQTLFSELFLPRAVSLV